jgi:hypothetical protein
MNEIKKAIQDFVFDQVFDELGAVKARKISNAVGAKINELSETSSDKGDERPEVSEL